MPGPRPSGAFNDAVPCAVCGLYDLARGSTDPLDLAPTLRRPGELYEQRGDRVKAVEADSRFAELWKDADPEFQPLLAEVRQRLARLSAERPLS